MIEIVHEHFDAHLTRKMCLTGAHLDEVIDELNELKIKILEKSKKFESASKIHIRMRLRPGDGTRSTDNQDCSLSGFSIIKTETDQVTDWYATIQIYSVCDIAGTVPTIPPDFFKD